MASAPAIDAKWQDAAADDRVQLASMRGGRDAATTGQPEAFARDVLDVIARLATSGGLSIRLAAKQLGTSPRTLQRRLVAGGLTYAEMVARARTALAREMLGDESVRIADIARRLGYSDASHFSRAFVRWTGITPRRFRQLRLARGTPRRRSQP